MLDRTLHVSFWFVISMSRGIDVLHKKSELDQELSKRRNTKRVKALEDERKNTRTSFEMKLEEQANKLSLVSDCYLK